MPKRKRGRAGPAGVAASPRQHGLAAFHQHDYTEAIRRWSNLGPEADPGLGAAVAEAHFMRGLAHRAQLNPSLADLRRAVELRPDEPRFWYHLGLTLHRADQLEDARAAYVRAAALGFERRGLGFVRGLAELELAHRSGRQAGPHLLEALPWLSADDRAALRPVAALLGGVPETIVATPARAWLERLTAASGSDPALALWQGLAWLAMGNPTQALASLAPPRGHPLRAGAESVRALYHGLALAATGQPQAALNEWTEAARAAAKAHLSPASRLSQAIGALRSQPLHDLLAAGRWAEVLKQVGEAQVLAPDETSLLRFSLVAANRLAQAAVEAGNWSAAVEHWQSMRATLEAHSDLGPLPPLFRNLAIAHEMLEQWEPAAEAWAALLRALPRRPTKKKPAPAGPAVDQQRQWLRRRILDNYRRGGRPDQAIAYYKQAVKAAPDDLDLRLELASALLANEQVIAARNELQRILAKDPGHVGAALLLAEVHQAREEWYAAEQALRRVLEIDPQHEAARRGLAQALLDRGVEAFNTGRYQEARSIYTEALTFSPADPQLLVFLAETELMRRDEPAARQHLEAALATGKPEAYIQVFESGLKRGREDEARQVLARAEAAGLASPHLYVDAGVACLRHGTPAAAPDFPLPGLPKRRQPATGKWEAWGRELIARGLAAVPNRGEVLRYLIGQLGMQQPAHGVEYARELVALEPEDPTALMALGMMQTLSQDVGAAKDTLRKAEKAARRQGQPDLARDISELRREVGSPLFGLLGPLLSSFGPDLLDELDDEVFFR